MPNVVLWGCGSNWNKDNSQPNDVFSHGPRQKQRTFAPALHKHQEAEMDLPPCSPVTYRRELLGRSGFLFEGTVMDGRNKIK